jgi:Tfp pilus assembly protein FimT
MYPGGFTLIELLVTTALSMVLIGGALAAYNSFSAQQAHVQAGQELVANLQRARSRSSAGEKPATCNRLDGYRVYAAAGANTYSVAIRCDGAATNNEVEQFSLPAGYTIQNAFSVIFPPLPANVSTNTITINIIRPNQTKVFRVSIAPSGIITSNGLVTP